MTSPFFVDKINLRGDVKMSFNRMKGILALFWLVASIIIVVLDINGVINLARNNVLFFGVILLMFVSFQIVTYFEKKANKK